LPELGHLATVAEDLDFALRQDVEAGARLALLVQRVAEGKALPLGAVHDLPQLDIAEIGKELQRAQQGEALGVEDPLKLPARHFAPRHQA
jgi:hypothetical protein